MDEQNLKSFEQFLKDFNKRNSTKKLAERTIKGILTLAKFLEPAFTGASVPQLRLKYKNYLESRNYPISKYTLWLYLKSKDFPEKTIKEVVNFKRITTTAINNQKKLAESVLSKKELLFLVDKIPKLRDQLLVKMLYDTGARISEILNIKLKDLDLKTTEIFVIGKGGKPRTVYFQKSTKKLLKTYLKEQNLTNPNDLVFTIKPVTAWYNLKKYGREILKRDLRPHMLRHSRLQHLADDGVDSFLIKSYAGHSDISTTQIYVKSSKFQGKMAFERGGDIWKKKK